MNIHACFCRESELFSAFCGCSSVVSVACCSECFICATVIIHHPPTRMAMATTTRSRVVCSPFVSLSLSFSLARSLSRAHATDGTNALATLGSTLQISGTQPNLSASKRGEGGGGGGSLRNTASLRSQGSFPLNSSLVRGDCIVAPAPFGPGNEYTEEVPRRWAESRST